MKLSFKKINNINYSFNNKTEKDAFEMNKKNLKHKENSKNNIKYPKKQRINSGNNLFKFNKKTPNSSNDNSLNNSFIIKSNKKEIIRPTKDNNKITEKHNISKPRISSEEKENNFGIRHDKINKKEKKIIKQNFNNYNKKYENYNNGINILNYKRKAPNNKVNKNDYSGENSQNINHNNSSSFNLKSIDHLFYKPSNQNYSFNNNFLNKISKQINPIRIKKNYFKSHEMKNFNNSFSLGNKKSKINQGHEKSNSNSFIPKYHSALTIGNGKKTTNKLKFLGKNNKLRKENNIFQPKNIFSKFKTKKNKYIIQEEFLLNQKLLIKNNQENKLPIMDKNNLKTEYEQEKNYDIQSYKNNNISSIRNMPNQNTQMNSKNLLSYTTLLTGTDIPNNNNSQNNIIEKNNNANSIFKGKKIKCIHDISKTGLSGEEKKVNQDRLFIFRNFVSGFENIFMGVLDGHGYYGHEVSEYIKENLPMDLNRVLKTKKVNLLKDDLSEIIKQTFEMENNSLLRYKQIDSNLSGSTCVSVIYTKEKLIIANLGDSRCILGKKINNEWKTEHLTRDHKPSLPEEAERIKSYGGRIRPMKDEDGNFIGPLRVYMKEKDIPGLAMTRSFGDYYASTAGTISIPEVSEYKFIPEDKFLILASDGLFEFMESNEVVNIVSEYYEKNDIVGCSEFLYKESYRKWIYEEEDTVDDITIILVFFED